MMYIYYEDVKFLIYSHYVSFAVQPEYKFTLVDYIF